MKPKITQVFTIVLLTLILSLPAIPAIHAQVGTELLDPLTIPKFENQLSGPLPVYDPQIVIENGKTIRYDYTVTMSGFMQQILPASMNLLTSVMGYGGKARDPLTNSSLGYVQCSPGPTFEVVKDIPAKVKWQNNVTSPYALPVDPTLHWANPNGMNMPMQPFPSFPPGYAQAQYPVPLVPHLHGGEDQSYSDGNPDAWFTSNGLHGPAYSSVEATDANAAVYYYPNAQEPTTLWYHDHALGVTRINVMSGLAGFYIIREPDVTLDQIAPLLPSGKYETPLVIQDRTFYANGSLFFPTVGISPTDHPYWFHSFLGDTIIVNGKAWPNMNVDQGQYRLRILDGSNARFYTLSFIDTQTNAELPFVQIGSDGGYLKTSASLTELTLGPAERADVLVDFSGLAAGTNILLKNKAVLGSSEAQTVGQIMQFTVTANNGFAPRTLPDLLNPTLPGSSFPTLPAPERRRILILWQVNGTGSPEPASFLLNGQRWSAETSELPVIGSTEDWLLVDLSGVDAHPIHLHLAQFQIVSRQKINAQKYTQDWIALQRQALGNQTAEPPWPLNYVPKELPIEPYLLGEPTPPSLNEQGWKDTVNVYRFQVSIIRIRWACQNGSAFPFDATQGPGYVWHCHIIDHEDNEMMRPYKVVSATPEFPSELVISVTAIIVIIVATASFVFIRARKTKTTKSQKAQTLG